MAMQQWCIVGGTALLLACEVTVSQLCNSLILLVDSFHTLYSLMHALHEALAPPQGPPPPPCSLPGSPALPPQAPPSSAPSRLSLPVVSPAEPPPGSDTGDPGAAGSPAAPPSPSAALATASHAPPPPPNCGLSYPNYRIQAVGGFLSALFLASLCVSGVLEIISLFLGPKHVRRHLLLVAVSGASLIHKMLVLWWNWDRELTPSGKSAHHEAHKGSSDEEQRIFAQVQPVENAALHNGGLVLCNPAASGLAGNDPENPASHAGENQDAKTPAESREGEAASSGRGSSARTSQLRASLRQWPPCLLSLALVLQTLGSALLALTHSLLALTPGSECQPGTAACAFLHLQDPALSSLAVIMLTAGAMLQVHRYGLLLLQTVPPRVCVSDLGQKIRSVPGVQAVHDLHIWQLSESVTVASVHVHCHAEFAAHRCADLMSAVTKVLHSVGVNCCTVQPEFASCSGSPPGQASAGASVEGLRLPCLLACSRSCAGFMCCSSLQEDTQTLPPPPAQEATEEPQTLIVANQFAGGQ